MLANRMRPANVVSVRVDLSRVWIRFLHCGLVTLSTNILSTVASFGVETRVRLYFSAWVDVPRKDWLSCIARDQRRYITPVPLGWEQWTDVEVLSQILRSKPDLRGRS